MAKSKDKEMCEAIAAALGSSNGKLKPPKDWWAEHCNRIREEHPEYDEKRIAAAVGAIWHKKYKPEKQELAVLAEALRHS